MSTREETMMEIIAKEQLTMPWEPPSKLEMSLQTLGLLKCKQIHEVGYGIDKSRLQETRNIKQLHNSPQLPVSQKCNITTFNSYAYIRSMYIIIKKYSRDL